MKMLRVAVVGFLFFCGFEQRGVGCQVCAASIGERRGVCDSDRR